jgi:hypothetical protein
MMLRVHSLPCRAWKARKDGGKEMHHFDRWPMQDQEEFLGSWPKDIVQQMEMGRVSALKMNKNIGKDALLHVCTVT